MLQTIRDKSQGWITWIIVIVICITFALWGIENYVGSGSSSDVLASVNEEPIYQAEIEALKRSYIEKAMELGGANFQLTPLLEQQINNQVLQQFINTQVALQSAVKEKFQVTDPMIFQFIAKMPAFQENNQFSIPQFLQVLRLMNETEQSYIDKVRAGMLIDQVKQGITDSAFVLPNELNNILGLYYQQRIVEYIVIPSSKFKDVSVSDSQLRDYYNAHKEQFKTQEQVSLNYILLSKENIAKQLGLNIDDKQVTQEFENKSQQIADLSYQQPESLESSAKAANLTIVTTPLLTRKELLEHASTINNNLLFNPRIIEAAFSPEVLNEGYNSNVIEVQDGEKVIVRINQKIPAKIKTYEAAKEEIKKIVEKEVKNQVMQKFSQTLITAVQKAKANLKQLANEHNLLWKENIEVSRQSRDLDVTMVNKIFEMPLSSPKKPVVESISLPNDDFVILQITQINSQKNQSLLTPNEHASFHHQLAEQNGMFEYEMYIKSLRDKAKIEINTSISEDESSSE